MKSFCSRVRHSQSLLAAVLASSAVFTAGCANMATTAGGSSLSNDVVSIGGRIHGGNQPVALATVQLMFAGQGSPATVVAQDTSKNDGTGSFRFVRGVDGGPNAGTHGNTYSCPASGNPLVYAVAKGGNTQNTGDTNINNDAAVFLAPFGPCKSITSSSFVTMTEVTTVATMAAWQQYFDPTTANQSFSSDGSGLSFLAMGYNFDLISNLVDLTSGKAVTSQTIVGAAPGGGVGAINTTVTATPETAKINTIANILAACINGQDNTASGCKILFDNATPGDPSTTFQPNTVFPVATNTLQAAYYMLANPTNGSSDQLSRLFALAPALGAPFLPTLGTAPSDWTIAINYSSGTSTCGNGGHLINSPQDLAVDSFGGIWIANNESNGNLSYLTHSGIPGTCVQVGTGSLSGITIDYVPAGLPNIWLADSGSLNVYRYHPTAASATAFPTKATPTSIAADGAGNVYYTSSSTSTLYQILDAWEASVPPFPAKAGVAIATGIGTGTKVIVDSAPSIWTTSGSNFVTRTADTGSGFTSTQFSTNDGPTNGIAVSNVLNVPTGGTKSFVFFDAATTNTLSLLQGSGTSYGLLSGWPATPTSSTLAEPLSKPMAMAVDGAHNVWTVNNDVGANSVIEIGVAQQQLSPATGFQKDPAFLAGGRSLVIDLSGNVWIGLDNSNSVTEIVGAAVPVYQPYALGLNNGQFQKIP